METPTPLAMAKTGPRMVPVEPSAAATTQPNTVRSFAFFPYRGEDRADPADIGARAWSDALDALANLAEPEEWTGFVPSLVHRPILNSYVRYTYQRLVMENKVSVTPDGEYAAFNTGLLTSYAEEVFAFFQRNRSTAFNAQPWYFLRWVTESDRDMMRHFPDVPELAEYVTTAADLVYDWRKPLKLAYEHILGDNLDRFPPELAVVPTRARAALTQAVELTLKRMRRNHKLVVPQWYPKLHEAGAQFLMPLDLTGSGSADLALVVSAVGDSSYRGHTVLTLEMAYTNARLVARPDSEWLKPQAPAVQSADDSSDSV